MKKQSTKRVGIAGYGLIGQRRRYHIDQHPGLKTVAVCDIKMGGSGVFQDGVNYCETYEDLLKNKLDILFVSLPNYLAPKVTIAG